MQIYNNPESIDLKNVVATIGMFDGVHQAHVKIIETLLSETKAIHGKSVILTFWPHPRTVLSEGKNPPGLLTTQEEKMALFESLGLDAVVIIPFTKDFSEWGAEMFVNQILINKIHVAKLIIGHDHHFGKDREGNFSYLKNNETRFGFLVEEIPEQFMDEAVISSTKIRKALSTGNCGVASKLLGRNYSITGTVVQGNQMGRKIGFPTANIKIDDAEKLKPANGVYAVTVQIEMDEVSYKGMLNIGTRPTFEGTTLSIEVHILDFDKDIYGKNVKVDFIERIRDEQKFDGIENLIVQLNKDKRYVIDLFQQ